MRQQLATLDEALAWVESKWPGQRPVPVRLHTRGTEGRFTVQGNEITRTYASDGAGDRLGSPPFSPAFMEALTGSAAATMVVTLTTVDETGTYERDVDRYRYPMTLALERLSKMRPPISVVHPCALVIALSNRQWRAESVMTTYLIDEAAILTAIRQLHNRYQEGPIGRPSWIDKSESQQRAELSA